VIARLLRCLLQCPASRRAFACGVLIGALAACQLGPRAVLGVPFGDPWMALPLHRLLVEDRPEPEAMAACRPPDCGPGLAVGVMRLNGRDAAIAERTLGEPERLARALSAPRDAADPRSRRPVVRTAASAKRLQEGPTRGFSLAVRRADGGRSAHGAVFGQRFGGDLRVVLVVGEEQDAVEAAARRVAREHLASPGVVSWPFSL
jgi:hypothetical protein